MTTSTTQQENPEPNITQYDQTYHYTNEDEMLELLIEVQAHEALWDRSSKLYHNSQQTRAAWVAITTNLNQEVETLKKMAKHVR